MRIFSNLGENILQDPTFGSLLRVGRTLSYAAGDRFQGVAPRATGLAFANNVPLAQTTAVFVIDHARNTLARVVGSLDASVLSTVGNLGVNVGPLVGFDIAPTTNVAFASFQLNGEGFSRLFVVNRGTGQTIQIGPVAGLLLRDIAVDTRGTSGFVSAAGFRALPPPPITPPVFTVPGVTFTVPGATTFGSSPITSPFFGTLTSPISPGLTAPLPPGLTSPLPPGLIGGGIF
jgi:hypothetical protein